MKILYILSLMLALQFATANADEQSSSDTQTPGATSSTAGATDDASDATLTLKGGSFAAGIGFVWGHGTVDYQGSAHKFEIHGVSVVDVGGSSISADGVVMHLSKLSDFNGTYTAWAAGATVGAGGSAVYMKNEHGVVIKLISSTTGLRFNLSGSGVTVTLKS
jgi:hypothetical protein